MNLVFQIPEDGSEIIYFHTMEKKSGKPVDSDKIHITQFGDSFHTTDLQFLSSRISMSLKGGGSTCKPYMISCSLKGMSKYCCVKCPPAICCIPLTEGHLSQRQRPRILRLMNLLTLLVSGALNIYAALWQILLCCGIVCDMV